MLIPTYQPLAKRCNGAFPSAGYLGASAGGVPRRALAFARPGVRFAEFLLLQIFGATGWAVGIFAVLCLGRIGALILAPAITVYAVALSSFLVRRLHDRGRSGWWLIPFLGVPLVAQGVAAQLLQSHSSVASWSALALTLLALCGNIWVFVEIGLRKAAIGTHSPITPD